MSYQTYITSDEMAGLPENPEEAFVALEAIVRERYQDEWNEVPGDGSLFPLWHRYMSAILPAARYYGIEALSGFSRPTGDEREMADQYRHFMDEVDYCVSELKLIIVARVKRHSVAIDAATKLKLRHLLREIRETVDKLDLMPYKKDRLYSFIDDLQEEIDRERTGLYAFGNFMIIACQYVAEGAKALEPAVRLAERMGAALGLAKQKEDSQPRLPPPQKKIPRPTKYTNGFDKKIDDEIPF